MRVQRRHDRLTLRVAKPVEYETRAGETPGQHVRCREHAFSRHRDRAMRRVVDVKSDRDDDAAGPVLIPQSARSGSVLGRRQVCAASAQQVLRGRSSRARLAPFRASWLSASPPRRHIARVRPPGGEKRARRGSMAALRTGRARSGAAGAQEAATSPECFAIAGGPKWIPSSRETECEAVASPIGKAAVRVAV